MSRLLFTTVLVLAILAAAGPARAGRDVLREQSRQDVDPRGIAAVRVENSRGDVQLERSADGQLHLTALKILHSNSRTESEQMSREIRVEAGTEGGQYVIRVRYPNRQSIRIGFWDLFRDIEVPSSEVRIGLQVPDALPVSVRTVSGDIHSAGVASLQSLESTSGDVDVSHSGGALSVTCTSGDVTGLDLGPTRLRTVSGDIEVSNARGPLDAHSTSGDMSVRGASDTLRLGSVTGDLKVDGAPHGLDIGTTSGGVIARAVAGTAVIGSSSGDVDLSVIRPLDRIGITTSSGDIRVRLGPDVGGELELRTSNGQLDLDAPIQVGTLTRRVVTGRIRQGKAPIVLRSASGDIHVYTGEKGS